MALGGSIGLAGLAVSSFAFGQIFGSYVAGLASDRFGEHRVIAAGAIGVAALVAAASVLPIPLLFVFLVFAGLASSTALPAGGRLVLLSFPRARHGLALSIRQCGVPIGALLAAALLPAIAKLAGWRWSLAAAAGLTLISVLPLLLWWRGQHVELPHAEPVRPAAPPSRDPNLRMLIIWGSLLAMGQHVILAFLALYLHSRAALSLTSASLMVSLANVWGIAGRVFWGAVSDRAFLHSRKRMLYVVNGATLSAAGLLFVAPRNLPLPAVAGLAAWAGFALIGYQGLFFTLVAELAGPSRVGAATGFAVTFVQIGIAVTPPVFAFVVDLAGTFRATWGVLALVMLVAFLPAARVRDWSRDARLT